MKKKSLFQLGLTSIVLLFALWCALVSLPVYADAQRTGTTIPQGTLAQVVITPTKDNTLFESASSSQLSDGAGETMFVGRLGDKGQGLIRRGLLAFDLAGRIPLSSTIVSVTLQLQLVKASSGATSITLHKVNAAWGEGTSSTSTGGGAPATVGDATWVHTFYDNKFWTQAGGDFAATALATTSASGAGTYTWGSTPALVADVQEWVNNPANNFGWLVRGDETTMQTAKQFGTRENALPANRPQLTIVYQAPGGAAQQLLYLPVVQR